MKATKRIRTHWQHSQLHVDAEGYFERLLQALAQATHSIEFEYYIVQLDALGERFVDALAAAAARGVRVRVLVDGIGSAQSSQALARRLLAQGVEVRIHRPLPWLMGSYRWSMSRGGWAYKFMMFLLNINRRNHRKLCVVDGHTAWVGSFNISANHLPAAAGGKGWRDYAVEVQGAAVASLVEGFDRHWNFRAPRFHRGFLYRYLSNYSLRARRIKNRFIARKVGTATRRVWLVSAYFAPTASLRRAILRACRGGRDVRLLLPDKSNVTIFPLLSRHYYRELLRAGARVFLYQGGMLHAKALLVDDLAVLGSSNWNYRSSLHDLELDVILHNENVVQNLERVIEADCADARELTLAEAPAPSLGSWFWYLLRYWM